jgi:hypothetical protein
MVTIAQLSSDASLSRAKAVAFATVPADGKVSHKLLGDRNKSIMRRE